METLIEARFALVFVRVLAAYLLRRDPLQRDLMLVFSAMAVLATLAVVRHFQPHPPPALSAAGYLTRTLTSHLAAR